MSEISRANWVKCPKCNYRFYVTAGMLLEKGVVSICPECRHEFDPHAHLEPKSVDLRTYL